MFVRAFHVAVCVVVFGCVHSGFDEYFRCKASKTVFCCQGGLLLLVDVHPGPVGPVCGEVAVVVCLEGALVVT